MRACVLLREKDINPGGIPNSPQNPWAKASQLKELGGEGACFRLTGDVFRLFGSLDFNLLGNRWDFPLDLPNVNNFLQRGQQQRFPKPHRLPTRKTHFLFRDCRGFNTRSWLPEVYCISSDAGAGAIRRRGRCQFGKTAKRALNYRIFLGFLEGPLWPLSSPYSVEKAWLRASRMHPERPCGSSH